MRDYHVTNRAALSVAKRNAKTAGVHRDLIVDEKAGQTLRRIRAAAGVERTG